MLRLPVTEKQSNDITMCPYSVNFKLLPSKVWLELFSATYYSVTRHTAAEANIDLLFDSEADFCKREGKEDLLQNLYCYITIIFFLHPSWWSL